MLPDSRPDDCSALVDSPQVGCSAERPLADCSRAASDGHSVPVAQTDGYPADWQGARFRAAVAQGVLGCSRPALLPDGFPAGWQLEAE